MLTFTINEQNQIVAYATPAEAAAAASGETFSSQAELATLAAQWPAERLLAIWNTLPGVAPIKKMKQPARVMARIWKRIQGLLATAMPPPAPADTAGPRTASATKRQRKGKAASGKPTRSRRQVPAMAPRQGSKAAQVLTLLRRKNGVSLAEIAAKTGWQKHTVRGFLAGTVKKAGYTVESFKPEGGTRTYRLSE